MESLVKLEQGIEQMMPPLTTMTSEKVSAISKRMVEMDRANQSLGRKNTQTTNQLMTLTMMTDSPYRRLRQCLSQIENKRSAIEDHYWRWREKEIEIDELRDKNDPLSVMKIEQHEYGQKRGAMYIEGALKEIAIFQAAYEEIRKNNNIPEDWDEYDAEMDEIRHHIRQAFRQSHRDMTLTGSITQGNAEYLEQYGIHLQTARNVIAKYIATCEKMLEEGNVPNVNHLYEFLDSAVEVFGQEYKNVVRKEFLYRSTQ